MNRILVTGSTGNIGRHVVDQLAAAGAQFRAMTRDPEAAGLPAHIDVVRGDLTDPQSLDACLQEIDTVFLVWVAPPDAIEGALEKIAKHARRIVYLTAPLKTPHPFFQQPNPSRAMAERVERLIEQSGLEWTFIRAGMFAGNARHFWGPQIRAGGMIRWPYLDAPTAPTDERDVATVAVRAMCDDARAAEYVVTGPESLTQAEQIRTIGRAIGRPLHVEEMTPDEARTELPGPGFTGVHQYAAQRVGSRTRPAGVCEFQLPGGHGQNATTLYRVGHGQRGRVPVTRMS